jgi:hypothetical protein
LTFTPGSSSSVYLITALAGVYNNAATGGAQLVLTDGTTTISAPGPYYEGATAASAQGMFSVSGIYAPGTTSPVTVKLQLGTAGSGGMAEITSGATGASSVEWTIIQIK